jgi:CRP-like cAMP-binding protein
MERAFASFQKRILANLAQSAKERYVSFINTYPNIEQTVKNYHIASYLGITTETLSRIRKEISLN